jgi:hypothetical protein
LFALSRPVTGAAQTTEEVNEANNPLTPKITVNLQDQYMGSYYGLSDSDSNSVLVRGVLPHKLFSLPQILRATIPIVTSPDPGGIELGIGPQLTMDSATDDRLGTGRWQLGAAGVVISPFSWAGW